MENQIQDETMQTNLPKEEIAKKHIGISGSTIKMIAIISMLIDHTAAAILGRYLILASTNGIYKGVSQYVHLHMDIQTLYMIYRIMRYIGRLGFPIFCFLLIEGFEHTRNVKKYAIRLFAFAIISEIPFDLAFHGTFLEFSYQNVFFTLFIGLLTIWAFRYFEQATHFSVWIRSFGSLIALVLGMGTAYLLHTDYAQIGVLCIVVLYSLRKNKMLQIIGGIISFSWELTAPLAFLPIAFYNGKRGWNMKYFFYIFYPAHLLIIYLICYFLGIGSMSVM